MIPGINVLNIALSVMGKQSIQYYQNTSYSYGSTGKAVPVYASPVTILGSFQPVPRRLYAQFGLSFQKEYFIFYVSKDLIDIGRQEAGDRVVFNGRRYQCESVTDWFNIDGWVAMLCVEVPNV